MRAIFARRFLFISSVRYLVYFDFSFFNILCQEILQKFNQKNLTYFT